MDWLTASASEILVTALRHGFPEERLHIIGEKSYGKGIGQVRFHMLNDAGLEITTMRFLPINGVSYHETGISPDQIYNGSFSTDQLLEAGRQLESGFENNVSITLLNGIVTEFNLFQKIPSESSTSVRGCFSIIETDKLPF